MKKIKYIFLLLFINTSAQISYSEVSGSQNINVSFGDNQFIGGLTFFDFDNDGWDDLTFASEEGKPVYFFKNNNGIFSAVNLNLTDYEKDNRQINWVDIDNDGDNDLFIVSNNASNRLYENDGMMNFSDITISSGLSTAAMFSWGASWGDYNNDGLLDVFISNRDIMNGIEPNILYKNNGDNTFTDVSSVAGIDDSNHYSFCASFFDFNNDGWQDIYIANDRFTTTNILYKNNGDETFTDVSSSSGTGIAIDAMSTTIDDYNNDGWLDIYITNTSSGNYFLKNNGNETFTNIAQTSGTEFNSVAWGAVFLDGDNDNDLDLYVSGMRDGSDGSLPSAFYENLGNDNFSIPVNAGFSTDTAESYSNAIGDINNDGFPDITVLNREPNDNFLWLNTSSSANNWLKIKLEGTTSNKMGIGSWIEISIGGNIQNRYTLCGEGYLSQNSSHEFFGLGSETEVDFIKIKWLSGIEDILYNVQSNQTLNIQEGSTLSIDKNSNYNYTVFPNPSSGKIHFQLVNSSDNFSLQIFNPLGQLIHKKENISEDYYSYDMSGKSGVFYVKVISNNIESMRKIIID